MASVPSFTDVSGPRPRFAAMLRTKRRDRYHRVPLAPVSYAIGSVTTASPSAALTASVAVGTSGQGTAARDAIAVLVSTNAGTVSGVTDSQNNTYLPGPFNISAASKSYFFYATSGPSGGNSATVPLVSGTDTITATFSTLNSSKNIIARGCPGVPPGSVADVHLSNTATSASPSVGPSTGLAVSAEWAIAGISNGNGGGVPSSWSSPFTKDLSVVTGANQNTSIADAVVSSASALTSSATIVSTNWTAVLMTLPLTAVPLPPTFTVVSGSRPRWTALLRTNRRNKYFDVPVVTGTTQTGDVALTVTAATTATATAGGGSLQTVVDVSGPRPRWTAMLRAKRRNRYHQMVFTGLATADTSVPVTATTTATAANTASGNSSLTVTGTVTSAATSTASANASLTVTAGLTAAATDTDVTTASLTVTDTITSAATNTASGDSSLTVTAGLTATASALGGSTRQVISQPGPRPRWTALLRNKMRRGRYIDVPVAVNGAIKSADTSLTVTAGVTGTAFKPVNLTNIFEGGTNGTTVTTGNSGGTSGSAFDVVVTGTGTTLTFDNTHTAHGSLALELATGVSAQSPYVSWTTTLGTVNTLWFREYLYITANPASPFRIATFLGGASSLCGYVQVLASGKLQFVNAAGAGIFTTTNTVPLNAWFRVEGFITGSSSVGQVELKLYNSMDSLTATETQTSAATQNTNTLINTARFGIGAAIASVGPFWMDDIGTSPAGYLGPELATSDASVTVTAGLSAAAANTASANAALTVTAGLSAAAASTGTDTATVTVTAGLSAAAAVTGTAAAVLPITAGITASGTGTRSASAVTAAVTAGLSAAALTTDSADTSITVTAGVASAALSTVSGSTSAAVSAGITAAAGLVQHGDAVVAVTAGITADTLRAVTAVTAVTVTAAVTATMALPAEIVVTLTVEWNMAALIAPSSTLLVQHWKPMSNDYRFMPKDGTRYMTNGGYK